MKITHDRYLLKISKEKTLEGNQKYQLSRNGEILEIGEAKVSEIYKKFDAEYNPIISFVNEIK